MDTFDQRLERADRLPEITQLVGFALWQLQELEGIAAQYFVLAAQAVNGMGLTAGNTLVEKAQNKAFGVTVRQLTKAGLVSSELELRFNNLLSERNWPVHKSRVSSRNAVHSDTATEKLVLRLNAIAEESLALLREIGVLTERYVTERGVSEQYINETANRLLEEWHASDAI